MTGERGGGAGPAPVGVILAAGKGTRLRPFSEFVPKPVLPVCNEPLLGYQLELLERHGIERVHVVIGHLGQAVVDALGDGSRWGVSIRYVEQGETLGLAHAVGQLEPHLDSPFVLLLGDIYLTTADLRPMIRRVVGGGVNACLASKVEHDPEEIRRNFSIVADPDGRVRRVIEKPGRVRSPYKGCGVYVFDLHVFDAIRRTPRTAMRDEYELTETIQIMVDDGLEVVHDPVVEEDVNLTYADDLLRVNLIELRRRGLETLVADDVEVPEESVLTGSVVGPGATFAGPVRLTNSLVLPGQRMGDRVDRDRVVVYEEGVFQCAGSA